MMKKIWLLTFYSGTLALSFSFLVFNFGSAMSLLDDAITRAYTKKLTMFMLPEDFRPYQAMRRDEAAKFFVDFAKLVGKTTYVVPAEQCQFSDLNQAWDDLRAVVVESCRLGIFKGSKGKFLPNGILTNAQAVVVLMRIIDGYQPESWRSHRAERYYERANALNLLTNVNLQDKEGLADRGNVIILLYSARRLSGVNEGPPINSLVTLMNRNTSLQGDDLKLSYAIQEIVGEKIKSLISSTLLDQKDLAMLDGKVVLHYDQWCTSFGSGYTQVMTMTYGDTSTTSLQSIDLHFSLCNDARLKSVWDDTLRSYAKWLIVHELGHYLYYIKDTTFSVFERICWEGERNICTADDFIGEYAQTEKYEDYAEHFTYWYLVTVDKEEPLWKPSNPNAKKFQAKMKYFNLVFKK